jgi:hypothetical protein
VKFAARLDASFAGRKFSIASVHATSLSAMLGIADASKVGVRRRQ